MWRVGAGREPVSPEKAGIALAHCLTLTYDLSIASVPRRERPLAMSRVIDDFRALYMPNAVSKFPTTPGITADDLPQLRSPPTPGQGSTSTKRSLSRDAKAFNEDRARFADDPGCFLTGFSCLSLEAAHLVNCS